MQQLIDYIERFVRLDSDAIIALQQLADIEVYKKNEHILEPGQRCNKIWFLKKGLVRKYHIHEGKEITKWIHTENDTFTSLQSYAQSIPSDEFIQAGEEAEVISITKSNSAKLAEFPPFVVFSAALMEREFVNMR